MDEEKSWLCYELWQWTANPFFGLRALELGWDEDWVHDCLDEIERMVAQGTLRLQVHPGKQGRKMDPPPIDENIISQPVTFKEVGRKGGNGLKAQVERWTQPPKWWKERKEWEPWGPWTPDSFWDNDVDHQEFEKRDFLKRQNYRRRTYPEMAELVDAFIVNKISTHQACELVASEVHQQMKKDDWNTTRTTVEAITSSIYKFVRRDWEPFNAAQG